MKPLRSNPLLLALAISVPLLLFGWYAATRPPGVQFTTVDATIPRNRTIEVGGISRPASDLMYGRGRSRGATQAASDSGKDKHLELTFGIVTCPKVPVLTEGVNPQMDSVIEAARTGRYPERLSPMHSARPFDTVAWKANPEAYLNDYYLTIAEPGRIYDVKQPGEDVPVLSNAGTGYAELREGESVRLVAKTLPGAPVTFTNFATGIFQNGLPTVTVAADADGLARAIYTGVTGPASADIVAGSPVASGTVRYRVEVLPALQTGVSFASTASL